jgi:hypothetical protein
MDISGLEAIAEVAIGLAGFAGVFVALTREESFARPEVVRLSFLLYTSLGAMFLALVPHALFTTSMSDETAWRVLGILTVAHTTVLTSFLARALSLRRDYPDIFPVHLVIFQGSQIFAALGLAICVLLVPVEDKQSFFIGTLIMLLAQAALVFTRLLFFRRS